MKMKREMKMKKRRIEMETTRKSVITRWTETDRKKKDNDGDSWNRSM